MRARISSDKLTIFAYFIAVILAGAALLSLPAAWGGDEPLGVLDALFTATSAVCVTGLIVVDTAEFTRYGQTLILLLIQFGGLGIVTFATLFIATSRNKVSLLNRGMIQEMYIEEVDANPRRIVLHIVVVTLAVEFLGFLVLSLRFKYLGLAAPAFTALFLSVSAFCNAGFSVFSDSLNRFAGDWLVNIAFMLLIISGGLGFVVMRDLSRVFMRTKRHASYHSRVVLMMTAAFILLGFAVFYMLEYDKAYAQLPVPQKLMAALFQSVTTRTAGFDTVAQGALSLPSILFVMMLMFIGGSPGSTAGGVKTTTVFMAIMAAFKGTEADGSFTYAGGMVSPQSIVKAFGILVKAMAIVLVSFTGLLAFEGAPSQNSFSDLLFEAFSAFGTVGLSRGITADLSALSKSTLILTMFAGRVGLFAMALMPPSDRIERFAEYPREDLMLG
jgi:trk system potassium uptake protein TrkH